MSAQRARTTLDKARELQRALYRAAKASPARRFHALYDKMYREDVLAKAWQEVKTNAGSAGVDGQTIEQIEEQGDLRDNNLIKRTDVPPRIELQRDRLRVPDRSSCSCTVTLDQGETRGPGPTPRSLARHH